MRIRTRQPNPVSLVKPLLSAALIVVLAVCGSSVGLAQAGPGMASDTIIVKFRGGLQPAEAPAVVAELGCAVRRESAFTPSLKKIEIPDGWTPSQLIALFADRPEVEYVEPTYRDVATFTPNDPQYSAQWHFGMVGMEAAWDAVPSRGSTSVTVAVLDSGIAYEDYGDDYIIATDLVGVSFTDPKDYVNSDDHANDDYYHGTHVCGTVAQATNNSEGVAGMADGVSIMPVKVLNSYGFGDHDWFYDGVYWAVDQGADIINYSAGGSHSATKQSAVQYAYDNGVLLIAAAGNGNHNGLDYPARYPEAMAVGAVDVGKNRADYSNWGDEIDVVAPGGEGSSTDAILQQTFSYRSPKAMSYRSISGTSMATPHVSGLAALLMTQGTYTTRAQVKTRIESTCEDLGAAGYDTTFGHGLIDAAAALAGSGPFLEWAGKTGYNKVDGVDPNTAPAGTAFFFRVKYRHPAGTAPTVAQVEVWRDGRAVKVRDMNLKTAPTYITGAAYQVKVRIKRADSFTYRFRFSDGTSWAVGEPAEWNDGPEVTSG